MLSTIIWLFGFDAPCGMACVIANSSVERDVLGINHCTNSDQSLSLFVQAIGADGRKVIFA